MEICKEVSSAVHKSSGKAQSLFSCESEKVQVVLVSQMVAMICHFNLQQISASFSSSGRVKVSPMQAQSYLGVTQTWVYIVQYMYAQSITFHMSLPSQSHIPAVCTPPWHHQYPSCCLGKCQSIRSYDGKTPLLPLHCHCHQTTECHRTVGPLCAQLCVYVCECVRVVNPITCLNCLVCMSSSIEMYFSSVEKFYMTYSVVYAL